MTNLMIVDLKMDEKLDAKALSAGRGGFVDSAWIYDSELIGSPVTTSAVNVYDYSFYADTKVANVEQNTLAVIMQG